MSKPIQSKEDSMPATLNTYAVTWSPALPALRHKVETTVVNAYSRDGAATAVANDYPAPIHVYSIQEEAFPEDNEDEIADAIARHERTWEGW